MPPKQNIQLSQLANQNDALATILKDISAKLDNNNLDTQIGAIIEVLKGKDNMPEYRAMISLLNDIKNKKTEEPKDTSSLNELRGIKEILSKIEIPKDVTAPELSQIISLLSDLKNKEEKDINFDDTNIVRTLNTLISKIENKEEKDTDFSEINDGIKSLKDSFETAVSKLGEDISNSLSKKETEVKERENTKDSQIASSISKLSQDLSSLKSFLSSLSQGVSAGNERLGEAISNISNNNIDNSSGIVGSVGGYELLEEILDALNKANIQLEEINADGDTKQYREITELTDDYAYVGRAEVGSDYGDSVWQIERTTLGGSSGNVFSKVYAALPGEEPSKEFKFSWNSKSNYFSS